MCRSPTSHIRDANIGVAISRQSSQVREDLLRKLSSRYEDQRSSNLILLVFGVQSLQSHSDIQYISET